MSRQQLPFKVECKSSYPFFELIAAFDCEQAATGYAAECSDTNPRFEYRVMLRGKPLNNRRGFDQSTSQDTAGFVESFRVMPS